MQHNSMHHNTHSPRPANMGTQTGCHTRQSCIKEVHRLTSTIQVRLPTTQVRTDRETGQPNPQVERCGTLRARKIAPKSLNAQGQVCKAIPASRDPMRKCRGSCSLTCRHTYPMQVSKFLPRPIWHTTCRKRQAQLSQVTFTVLTGNLNLNPTVKLSFPCHQPSLAIRVLTVGLNI